MDRVPHPHAGVALTRWFTLPISPLGSLVHETLSGFLESGTTSYGFFVTLDTVTPHVQDLKIGLHMAPTLPKGHYVIYVEQ